MCIRDRYWTADLKSSELWSSQLLTQFKQLRRTGIARSRVQTPLKSWLFQASIRKWAVIIAVEKVRTWTGFEPVTSRYRCDALTNWAMKPLTVRTSTGFEPVTSRYRCDALTNWAMKPLTVASNPVEVLTFSGFYTQLLKICVYNCDDHSSLEWLWCHHSNILVSRPLPF